MSWVLADDIAAVDVDDNSLQKTRRSSIGGKSGGLKLQCIAIATFSSYVRQLW